MSRAGAAASRERKRLAREVEQWTQDDADEGWDEGHQIVACDECGLEQVQLLDAFGHWRVPPVLCVLCGCETAHHVRLLARP